MIFLSFATLFLLPLSCHLLSLYLFSFCLFIIINHRHLFNNFQLHYWDDLQHFIFVAVLTSSFSFLTSSFSFLTFLLVGFVSFAFHHFIFLFFISPDVLFIYQSACSSKSELNFLLFCFSPNNDTPLCLPVILFITCIFFVSTSSFSAIVGLSAFPSSF